MSFRLPIIGTFVIAGYLAALAGFRWYQGRRDLETRTVAESAVSRQVGEADARHARIESERGYRVVTKGYRCLNGEGEVVVKGKDKEVRHLSWRELRLADGCVTLRDFFRWERRMVFFSLNHDCSAEDAEQVPVEERVWFHGGRPIRRLLTGPTTEASTGSEAEATIAADYAKAMRIAETGKCSE